MKSDLAGLEEAGLESNAQLLVGKLLELVEDRGKPSPILLIDGRAGSGKSTLADAVNAAKMAILCASLPAGAAGLFWLALGSRRGAPAP